jgi:hypothetical protein
MVYASLSEVRCPVCGGAVNAKWFVKMVPSFQAIGVQGDCAVFVAECWSDSLADDAVNYGHMFEISIPIMGRVVVERNIVGKAAKVEG